MIRSFGSSARPTSTTSSPRSPQPPLSTLDLSQPHQASGRSRARSESATPLSSAHPGTCRSLLFVVALARDDLPTFFLVSQHRSVSQHT